MELGQFLVVLVLALMGLMGVVLIGCAFHWPVENLNEQTVRFVLQAFLVLLGLAIAGVSLVTNARFWLVSGPGGVAVAAFALMAVLTKFPKRMYVLTGIACLIAPVLLAFLFAPTLFP